MTSISQNKKMKKETVKSLSSIKQVSWTSIEEPQTVEKFRENLKKYFMTVLDPKTKTTYLVTREMHIDIERISKMDDIYEITKTGWCGSGRPFHISPLFETSFMDGERCFETITTNYPQIIDELKRVKFVLKWVGMDNQIYRKYFVKTLGNFSGYSSETQKEAVN